MNIAARNSKRGLAVYSSSLKIWEKIYFGFFVARLLTKIYKGCIIVARTIQQIIKKQNDMRSSNNIPTLKDIALESGFSRSSVAAVLSGKAEKLRIKPATSEMILKTAKQLGYYRNGIASSMVTRKSNVIAYFSFDMERDFIGQLIYGITTEAAKNNYFLKLFTYDYAQGMKGFEESVRSMLEQRPAGIICQLHFDIKLYEYFCKEAGRFSIPIVFVGSKIFNKGIFIRTDDVAGGIAAVKHLYKAGHKRIGYLGFTEDNQLRYKGYKSGLKECGIKYEPNFIFKPEDMNRYFSYLPEKRPTAIFGATDNLAMGFFRKAYAWGVKVPQDISLIGFGDTTAAKHCIVPLTTIHQPFRELGIEMAKSICKEINEPKMNSFEKVVGVELIERESVSSPTIK